MTLEQFSVLVRRRALFLTLGLLATLAASGQAWRADGTYWAHESVVFLPPSSHAVPNKLQNSTDGLIATAGLVAYKVSTEKMPRYSAPFVSSYTFGLQEEVHVSQPNYGGQWAVNFTQPILDVQVVSDSPDKARSELDRQVQAINDELSALQESDRVPSEQLITTLPSSDSPSVRYVRGSPIRAALALLLLGGALTFWGAGVVDRIMSRHGRSGVAEPALRHAQM